MTYRISCDAFYSLEFRHPTDNITARQRTLTTMTTILPYDNNSTLLNFDSLNVIIKGHDEISK